MLSTGRGPGPLAARGVDLQRAITTPQKGIFGFISTGVRGGEGRSVLGHQPGASWLLRSKPGPNPPRRTCVSTAIGGLTQEHALNPLH